MNEEKSLLRPDVGELIKEAVKKHPKTQIEIAETLHLSTKQLQNYSKGIFPRYKSENIKALDNLLGTNVYEMVYKGEPKSENKVLSGEQLKDKIEVAKRDDTLTLEVIKDLVASNRLLADATHILAENNRELTQLTKQQVTAPPNVANRLTEVEKGLSQAASNQLSMYAFQMAFQETVFDLLKAQQSKKKEFGEKVLSFLEKFQTEGVPTL